MSGTTVVIGGLMRDDKETVEKKIPLLADIPLIGGLFKVDRDRIQKTNLLLFITPHVLTGREDLDEITETKKQQVEQSTTNAKG
jgi:general secretion pathway protein D